MRKLLILLLLISIGICPLVYGQITSPIGYHLLYTPWRIIYTDSAGEITELTFGANGTFLESNGTSLAPAFRVLVDGDIPTTLTLETISGTPAITNGVAIGTDQDANLIDDTTTGSGSTTLWIGDESILVSGDIGTSVQAEEATLTDIADGTIEENLVNTNNPWADDEIASSTDWNSAYVRLTETYENHIHVPVSQLGKNVTNPPTVNNFGITKVFEFTINTDVVHYSIEVPHDYASGNLLLHIHWTRSTTGSDESAKTVKWQVKNLVINGTSEEISTGENTDSIQDVYDSNSTTDKIGYLTGDMVISTGEFSVNEMIVMEIMAITVDSGVALSEPALIALGFTYTAYKIIQ